MPIYEYHCLTCGKVFEEIVANSNVKIVPCPKCKSQETEKLMSRIGGIGIGKSNNFACSSGGECPGASACGAGGCCHNMG